MQGDGGAHGGGPYETGPAAAREPTDNLEDLVHEMGDPATEGALPQPSAPDLEKLPVLCARTGIELAG